MLTILCMVTLPTLAQQWKPLTGSVTFKIKMWGLTVDGSFKGLVANLAFDPNNLAQASIVATVDARTIDTDNSLRDDHLRDKEAFFDTKNYPVLRIKSTRIEKSETGYLGTFELTMKKTTKLVKIPFTFLPNGEQQQLKGSVTINRRDWNVGGGSFGLSDNVTINLLLNVQAVPKPEN